MSEEERMDDSEVRIRIEDGGCAFRRSRKRSCRTRKTQVVAKPFGLLKRKMAATLIPFSLSFAFLSLYLLSLPTYAWASPTGKSWME